MFVDEVRLIFKAGKGGDGAIAWRRESHVPKGGPFGGPGGRGADVVLFATNDLHTLSDFRHKKEICAPDGVDGGIKMLNGANGETLRVAVPVGTLVADAATGKILADLDALGKEHVLCRGGRGGYGNAHFQSSTRQAPAFAELGDRGETADVVLELKLVADVALVGLPNAGKSTMISALTNARPKIANYPFTTLVPNLGIMEWKGRSAVIEDVPGLIEGAADGKGLGIQFLKHIERAGAILHLVDASQLDACVETYRTVRAELKKYSKKLAEKEEIVALTKADTLEADIAGMVLKEFKKKVRGKKVFLVSSAAGTGMEELRAEIIAHKHEASPEAPEPKPAAAVYDLTETGDPERWEVRRVRKLEYEVTGRRIQQIVRMTMMDNREGVFRVWDVLYKIGALREIARLADKDAANLAVGDARYNVFARLQDAKVTIEGRVFAFGDVAFMFAGKQ